MSIQDAPDTGTARWLPDSRLATERATGAVKATARVEELFGLLQLAAVQLEPLQRLQGGADEQAYPNGTGGNLHLIQSRVLQNQV